MARAVHRSSVVVMAAPSVLSDAAARAVLPRAG
jgi:hypothetical protein